MSDNMKPPGGGGNGPLQPSDFNGEPRIRDLDLAARLGFSDPHKIRSLIERHADALAALGVSATVAETSPKGGRPGKAYYLNRKQAIFITAKSETTEATEITIEIIERFDAYESGLSNKASLAARRVKVSEMNAQTRRTQAANRTMGYLAQAGGRRAIIKNAKSVYGQVGIDVDLEDTDDEPELDLPPSKPKKPKGEE